ncbi:MAG: hypothetical protein BBJ57_07355 [Desulfobacterales bacterium PC51MH44]|nr:MAG: hypothetical protein BBJ57_07355 [Desulfobacterales bacterium PC51MH44]
MDLTESAINKILSLSKPERMEIDGIEYTTGNYRPLIDTHYPEPLKVSTLTGLTEYINKEVDKLSIDSLFLLVASPRRVCLTSKLDQRKSRAVYIEAELIEAGFNFNRHSDTDGFLRHNFINLDQFIIGIQSQFKDGEKTFPIKQLLEFVSTIKSSNVKKVVDNGISQTTHLESGITGSELVEIAGPQEPILLKPFRTFREIDQPESLFQLRMDGSGQNTTMALFEADGGAWKLEAVRRIKGWLDKNTKATVIA